MPLRNALTVTVVSGPLWLAVFVPSVTDTVKTLVPADDGVAEKTTLKSPVLSVGICAAALGALNVVPLTVQLFSKLFPKVSVTME